MSKPVRIAFLGGLGEIGRNCMAIEQDKKILLIDCGLMFPKAEHGDDVDVIIPDFEWLIERKDRIVGCVVTHGHEDHVGALQYLLQDASFPLYGSALTLGLARNRIAEARLTDRTRFVEVSDNDRIKIGPFEVEFIPVTHSVPHAHAIALHTSQGVVVHSGDFKIDLTPVDHRRTDLARLGSLSCNEGIRLLMLDSTNAGERGHAPSESDVGSVLRSIFNEHRGRRIITASFASHIHRVQQIADAAIDSGRVVVPLGRSMINNIRLARELKALTIPEKCLVGAESLGKYDDEEICIISTGSQGEAMSALTMLAKGDSRYVKVGENDVVIFSSHAIPGNEQNVNKVIDALLRRGANVVHSGIADVHATGHAQAEDIKTYLNVTEPQWFVPIHGEYRHMVANAELAKIMGVSPRKVLLCEDGDVIEITDSGIDFAGRISAEFVVPQKSQSRSKKARHKGAKLAKRHKKH
ncbi:MAG: ribonuclease J [Actinobacteria bacterium]|nr:ribonuclease J [Actinomycetota bacterium]